MIEHWLLGFETKWQQPHCIHHHHSTSVHVRICGENELSIKTMWKRRKWRQVTQWSETRISKNKLIRFGQHISIIYTRLHKIWNTAIKTVPIIYPVGVPLMTTKQNGIPHFNTTDINGLPKFILHYKIHSEHGNEPKTELGTVCRTCKLLIIC